MGFRDTLNQKPALALGLAIAIFGIAVAWGAIQLSRGGGSNDRAFFTIDDGTTWFVDDVSNLPPFQHKGKEAVRVYVFECSGKQFANHLERMTSERKKLAEAARNHTAPTGPTAVHGGGANWGSEFKKPGTGNWVAGNDMINSSKILQVKCADGQEPVPVDP